MKMFPWGFEDLIRSAQGVTLYRLEIRERGRTALQIHSHVDHFIRVAKGLLYVEMGEEPDRLVGGWIGEGEQIEMPAGGWHRLTALSASTVYDFVSSEGENTTKVHIDGYEVGEAQFRELLKAFCQSQGDERILDPERAGVMSQGLRKYGRRIGLVSGVFDLFHAGHAEILRKAKDACETLFVAVNDDTSARLAKSGKRPYSNDIARMAVVGSIRSVDYVVASEDQYCRDVIRTVTPDVYFVSSDNGVETLDAKEESVCGGTVQMVETLKGFSISGLARTVAESIYAANR